MSNNIRLLQRGADFLVSAILGTFINILFCLRRNIYRIYLFERDSETLNRKI